LKIYFAGTAARYNFFINNGKIVPIEFANIVLYSEADSTKMIAGTVSDLKGNYLFGHLGNGKLSDRDFMHRVQNFIRSRFAL